MAPNKDWMNLVYDRLGEDYDRGVKEFLDYAFQRGEINGKVRCPCVKCCNTTLGTRESVTTHLKVYGIIRNYTFWYHHGERIDESSTRTDYGNEEPTESDVASGMHDILRDLHPDFDECEEPNVSSFGVMEEEPNDEAKVFYNLLKDSQQPLFEGSRISKLLALVKLLHIKTLGGWSNASFNMLLKMLKDDILPKDSSLPDSYYESKKIIRALGLSYEKIDACDNNCILYRKEYRSLDSCEVCGSSRYKVDKHSGDVLYKANGKRLAKKTLRYFPLRPRLQRLFMSRKIASWMRWHHEGRIDDGIMRHPADSMEWKSFDTNHGSFSEDPRNIRLGLASDGFQPFNNSKTPYSIWPVILIPYNLPPWMAMKPSNFILSMLIPGPESPGDTIDVFLEPLIGDLQKFWHDGVDTYDVSKRQNFKLRASLLWTINDFPAYGNLSGWSTKGKLACPCCNKDTLSLRLSNGCKQCYMCHRRFLPSGHRWRNDKDSFDGTKERRLPPTLLSGSDILYQVRDLEGLKLTKAAHKKVKISHESRGDNWNKRSIFFDLPYWETLSLRHNLDVMHIEKNICDSVLGTILNLKGKSKDNLKSRLDLEAMGIRPELHPVEKGGKKELPQAQYTMLPEHKHKFYSFLKQLKVPDGFSSNISHCVNLYEHKISGLKSHDCHILLHHLIPLAIRGLLPKVVCDPLIELSLFFKILGSKALDMSDLQQIESQIPTTLCKLEKIFPPSFFDVMMHLPIHLANEAKVGGPVHYRWMYPVERYLHELKSFVRNRAHPEGSIAEGYIAKECMNLCSRYLDDIETNFNRIGRNDDGGSSTPESDFLGFSQVGKPISGGKTRDLTMHELEQAHIYLLRNCEAMEPFIEEYDKLLRDNLLQIPKKDENRKFIQWLKTKVARLCISDKSKRMTDLLSLSRGPLHSVTCFSGYLINGFRFHTSHHDMCLRTQNSGVVVIGNNGVDAESIDYFGVLSEVVELQFIGGRRVVLFHCDWFDIHNKVKGMKVDEYGFVSINLHRLLKTDEPFILASQASQVFYASDITTKGWHLVVKVQPRDHFALQVSEDTKNADVNETHPDSHSAHQEPVASSSLG